MRLGNSGNGRRDPRRGEGDVENVIPVAVLGNVENGSSAIRPARDDDGELHRKGNEGFQDQRPGGESRPGGGSVCDVAQHRLPSPVIAKPGRLQHRGQAEFGDCGAQLGLTADRTPGGGGDASLGQEALFGDAVLANRQHLRAGVTGGERAEDLQRAGRHILEFEGHHIDGARKFHQRRLVRVVAHGVAGGDLHRRLVGLRGEDMRAVAEPCCRQRRHAPQLAATEDADGGIRLEASG